MKGARRVVGVVAWLGVVSCDPPIRYKIVTVRPGVDGVLAFLPPDPSRPRGPEYHREEARRQAEDYMKRSCFPAPFEIVQEGEVAIGTVTNTSASASQQSAQGQFFGVGASAGEAHGSGQRVETSLNEYRIQFRCRQPAAANAAPIQDEPHDGSARGCWKDTDCKGDRICQKGDCIDPAPRP